MTRARKKFSAYKKDLERQSRKVKHPLVNAAFLHPFTCVVAGPTASGKTTFVANLILNKGSLIDKEFRHVLIFLGTSLKENSILSELPDRYSKKYPHSKTEFDFWELRKMYGTDSKHCFSKDIIRHLTEIHPDRKVCLIFDDLMKEIADGDVLDDIFTKMSHHGNISCINITQNLFFQGKGRGNLTHYRNTQVLVLFRSILDQSYINTVATRMGLEGKTKRAFKKMCERVQKKYRYIVIRGDSESSPLLRYSSDLFARQPFRHYKTFHLTK